MGDIDVEDDKSVFFRVELSCELDSHASSQLLWRNGNVCSVRSAVGACEAQTRRKVAAGQQHVLLDPLNDHTTLADACCWAGGYLSFGLTKR